MLLHNGEPKARFVLGERTAIGRSSECEVQVLNPGLSRRHAVITRSDDAYWIEDLDSQNGTFVAGQPVAERVRLVDGCDVQLGTVAFIFNPAVEILHDERSEKTVCILADSLAAAPETERLSSEAPPPDSSELAAAFSIACDVAAELGMDSLPPVLLNKLMGLFSADRGFILTRKPSGMLVPRAVVSDKGTAAVSRSLVERAFSSGEPLLFRDALESLSFVGARSVVAHRLRSVMLAPLMSNGTPVGMLQLDSHRPDVFTQKSLALLSLLARPAALAIENARRYERSVRKHQALKRDQADTGDIITRDPAMIQLIETAKKAAASNARVLITGESGTGKELVARLIHKESPRAHHPFVAINCGAILESVLESELFGHEKGAFTGAAKERRGCFALADEGTLFLDEVAELAPATQIKLLRVLQEGTFYPVGAERPVTVDVRVIAATHQDLKALVAKERFREDLFFRLNVIQLEIPPLRARQDDVERLMTFFIDRFSIAMSKQPPALSSQAAEALRRHPWPGNVRELQNMAERLVVLSAGRTIHPSELPADIMAGTSRPGAFARGNLKEALRDTEREMISRALQECRGNKAAACRLLGISRPTLDKKLVEHDLEWSP